MDTKEEIEALERLLGQLTGLHTEISQLAKKAPNDALNSFKVKLVNKVLASGNAILDGGYRPFDEFGEFDYDDLPTNSDVTMILTQYMEQSERYRSDNVVASGGWKYVLSGKASSVPAAAPTRVGDK
jgi:hypothetical protein